MCGIICTLYKKRVRLREREGLSQGHTAGVWRGQASDRWLWVPLRSCGHAPPPPNGSTATSGTFFLGDGVMKQMQSSAGRVWDWLPLWLPGTHYFKACSACQCYRLSKGGQGHPLLPKAQGSWLHGSSKPRRSKNNLEWVEGNSASPEASQPLATPLTSEACFQSRLDGYHKSRGK